MDDPFVSCPFEAIHRVPRSRLQGHIVKCQERHPGYQICPYNATHRCKAKEFKAHVMKCPSQNQVNPEVLRPKVTGDLKMPKTALQSEYLPETDPNHEMWDD